jgi:hypothetical protein
MSKAFALVSALVAATVAATVAQAADPLEGVVWQTQEGMTAPMRM